MNDEVQINKQSDREGAKGAKNQPLFFGSQDGSPIERYMSHEIEYVASQIVDAAVKIHKALGPGLLESAYQKCLLHELEKRNLKTKTEVPIPIHYDGIKINAGYRADLLVEGCIIVENKTVDSILPLHQAQLLTYLKLSGCPIGFILNWKVALMKEGIRRMIWSRQ